jgi:hypothetical protein
MLVKLDTRRVRVNHGFITQIRLRDGEKLELMSRAGALEIDWPRSIGYFGGIALAVGTGLVDPPLGLFIAAVPFLKMLDLPGMPRRLRFIEQILEGVAKPVGGDSEGTVRIVDVGQPE